MNFQAGLTLSREEQDHMRRMEQLRRKGHTFFKVIFNGPVRRVHCLKDINLEEHENPTDGTIDYVQVEGDRAVEAMERDPSTGQYQAWVYDDPDQFNRYWLSRNMDAFLIEIEDEKINRAVEALKSKEFKMAETEYELLSVEKRKIERRLKALDEELKEKEEQEKRGKKSKKIALDMTTDKLRVTPIKPVDRPLQSSVKGIS